MRRSAVRRRCSCWRRVIAVRSSARASAGVSSAGVRYPAAGACRDGGWGEGFPDGVVGVDEGGVGEPAQVGQAVVAGQAQALAQAGDEEDAAGGEGGGRGPLVAEGGQGAGGGLVPVRRCPAVVGVVVGFGEG